jgi:hypothetical protein
MRDPSLRTRERRPLFGTVLRLRLRAGMVQKESHDFLKDLLPNVYGAMYSISWFYPVDLADSNIPWYGLTAVAKLDVQKIAAQDHGHPMKWIVVPGRRFAGSELLASHEVVSTMVQHLLVCRQLHIVFPARILPSLSGRGSTCIPPPCAVGFSGN